MSVAPTPTLPRATRKEGSKGARVAAMMMLSIRQARRHFRLTLDTQ